MMSMGSNMRTMWAMYAMTRSMTLRYSGRRGVMPAEDHEFSSIRRARKEAVYLVLVRNTQLAQEGLFSKDVFDIAKGFEAQSGRVSHSPTNNDYAVEKGIAGTLTIKSKKASRRADY